MNRPWCQVSDNRQIFHPSDGWRLIEDRNFSDREFLNKGRTIYPSFGQD
jgi:hypothetical protein